MGCIGLGLNILSATILGHGHGHDHGHGHSHDHHHPHSHEYAQEEGNIFNSGGAHGHHHNEPASPGHDNIMSTGQVTVSSLGYQTMAFFSLTPFSSSVPTITTGIVYRSSRPRAETLVCSVS